MIFLLITLLINSFVNSHSWVEQARIIKAGRYVGVPGYSRSYIPRNFPGGQDLQYRLPTSQSALWVSSDDLVCSPKEQKPYSLHSTPVQFSLTPPPITMDAPMSQLRRLRAAPGDFVALRYLENGHVTFVENDIEAGKADSGLVYIYATLGPNAKGAPAGQTLLDVFSWTNRGSLNKGRLLTVNDFDDSRCYELNSAPRSLQRQAAFNQTDSSLWCESNFQVPSDIPAIPGTILTIYWVWDWPSPGVKDQVYTSCLDVEIVPSAMRSLSPDGADLMSQVTKLVNSTLSLGKTLTTEESSPIPTLFQQDPNTRAVNNYIQRAHNASIGIRNSTRPTNEDSMGQPKSVPMLPKGKKPASNSTLEDHHGYPTEIMGSNATSSTSPKAKAKPYVENVNYLLPRPKLTQVQTVRVVPATHTQIILQTRTTLTGSIAIPTFSAIPSEMIASVTPTRTILFESPIPQVTAGLELPAEPRSTGAKANSETTLPNGKSPRPTSQTPRVPNNLTSFGKLMDRLSGLSKSILFRSNSGKQGAPSRGPGKRLLKSRFINV